MAVVKHFKTTILISCQTFYYGIFGTLKFNAMSTGWIIFILGTIGWHIGMYGRFKKAGIESWKALVPFYNTWCMLQKMQLKKYWFFLQFITIWICIKFVEHFGRFGFWHHGAAVFFSIFVFSLSGLFKKRKVCRY